MADRIQMLGRSSADNQRTGAATWVRRRLLLSLVAVGVAQTALLALALVLLVGELRKVQLDLERLDVQQQAFLKSLEDFESDMYRVSLLARDSILLEGDLQRPAQRDLMELLDRMSAHHFPTTPSLTPEAIGHLRVVESARREYVAKARQTAAWSDAERRRLGPAHLGQLVPLREKLIETTRDVMEIVRALEQEGDRAVAESLREIRQDMIRILLGAAVLGLAFVFAVAWRLRTMERERELYLERLRQAENDLRSLSKGLVESHEFERKRLSRELHDEVGQTLTALRVQLGQIQGPDAAASPALSQAADLADRALRAIRELSRGLRPAMLDDLGLAPALRWLGRDFSKNTAVEVDVQVEGELDAMDERQRTCVYRVVQEALTNCVKHSGSSAARVAVREERGALTVTVQDDGKGISPGGSHGIGLLGMRERVEELGGQLSIQSRPGHGTRVEARLPLIAVREMA